MESGTYVSVSQTTQGTEQNVDGSSPILPTIAVSSENFIGSFVSSHTETLEGQSLVDPSLNPTGSSLSPLIQTLVSDSMVHSQSNIDGFSPIMADSVKTLDLPFPSAPTETLSSEFMDHSESNLDGFSPILADSAQTHDGSFPSSHSKTVGDMFLVPQSPNLILSSPILVTKPENVKTLGGILSNQDVSSLYAHIQVPDDQSLVPKHVETLDYESVVSLSSDGSRSSSTFEESLGGNQCLVPVRPCMEASDDDNDHSATMQLELSGEGPLIPHDYRPLDKEDCDDDCDEEEQIFNFEGDAVGRLPSENPNEHLFLHRDYYHGPRHPYDFVGNEFNHFPCPLHHRYNWCGPECQFQSRMSWDASRGNTGKREEGLPGFLLPAEQETGPTGVGAGLSNLGLTCFLNAILQCLTHTVPLVKAIRSCSHVMPCECAGEGFCVLCALHDHIELSLASSGKIISPLKLVDNLNNISSCFQRNQQEDAHEFLQCLLDRLERCCLDLNPTDESLSFPNDNIVEQVFGGRLVSKLRCCNCGHCSDTYEPLIDLSLEIEDVETLQSALESFTKVEQMEDAETKFTCASCKENVSMEKQLMLDQAPSVAVMHLKRFKTSGSYVEKIGKHVKFPLELDLQPYIKCSQESNVVLKYQLYAFVVHVGLSPTYGHYFCYIRSSPGTWHKLDDSKVEKLQEELVLSQDAYILFYARESIPWFSSLIESQKLCVDPRMLSTSPKSVLENVDVESISYRSVANVGNGQASITADADEQTLTHLSCGTMIEEVQIDETLDDIEGISTQNPDELRQSGPNLCCDGSRGECTSYHGGATTGNCKASKSGDAAEGTPTYFPCRSMLEKVQINETRGDARAISAQISCESRQSRLNLHCDESRHDTPMLDDRCNQDIDKIGGNDGLHRPTSPPSLSPEKNFGGLPEGRYRIPRDHLKVENRVSCKRPSKKAIKDSQRMEAVRQLKKMPNARSMMLLSAMLPQNDKKRLRSSPCKRGSPAGPSRKHTHRVAVMR